MGLTAHLNKQYKQKCHRYKLQSGKLGEQEIQKMNTDVTNVKCRL